MSGTQKKYLALAGLVLAIVSTALLSLYPANPTIHTVCENALKVLALFGIVAPVSVMNPNPADGGQKLQDPPK